MLDVKLKVASGRHQGQLIPLTTRKFLIGREQDCQLRTNSDLVSRHHCVFAVDDYGVRLRDLGSTNGTLVNGERIREVVLKPDDRVQIGKLEFVVLVSNRQVAESPVAAAVAVDAPSVEPITEEPETVSLSAEETQFELAAPPPPAGTETQYELPIPAAASAADTTILQHPAGNQPPPGYPPGYPPPGGVYPQWPYGAPGQYYGAPYGAPYAPPGYPPQMPYPGYPPQYPQQPAPAPASSGQGTVTAPPVRLPPPELTGAVATPPPAPAAPEEKSDEPKAPPQMTPSQRAAEIIKQRTRRPSSS
jgi:predicted component of type VI protein secretion system